MKKSENTAEGIKDTNSNSQSSVESSRTPILVPVQNFGSYSEISGPGVYENIQVIGTPHLYDPIELGRLDDKLGLPRYIINFKAILGHRKQVFIDQVKELAFKDDEDRLVVDLTRMEDFTATHSVIIRDGIVPDLPMKGELVEIMVSDHPSGEEGRLIVTGFTRQRPKAAKKVDLGSIFEELEKDD